jgi:hypothetical protein
MSRSSEGLGITIRNDSQQVAVTPTSTPDWNNSVDAWPR